MVVLSQDEGVKRFRRRAYTLLALLPLFFAASVFGGYYMGIYLSEVWDLRESIALPLLLTTVGFAGSLVVAVKVTERVLMVRR